MDTATFKNALRRFLALRGHCKLLRSDRGTNFVGAKNQDINIEEIQGDLGTKACEWRFNPPHASHFGGVWERQIGAIRRIMDGTMAMTSQRSLSLDEFSTLLQESAAIVNSTPLW